MVAARFGDGVRSRDEHGRPALDLRAAVASSLRLAGVVRLQVEDRCTAADPWLYSWRARQDRGRQGTWVVKDP